MALLTLIRHARSRMRGDAPARWPLSKHGQRQAGVLARQDLWREVELIFWRTAGRRWLSGTLYRSRAWQ